ncbi:MAG: glycosyltransferase family 4 protein [Alphaproteobacteria bacterium]
MAVNAIALTWPPSALHGWGEFGTNLLREVLRRGAPKPITLLAMHPEMIDAADRDLFQPLMVEQHQIEQQIRGAQGNVTLGGVHVLHSLGNNLEESAAAARFRGEPNVGFTFFENMVFGDNVVADNAHFQIMMAGSTWNADILRDLGFPRVGCVFQGIDPDAFAPGPRTGRFSDRFVVFSGGKLELRKGQDLVVAAFKRFQARHPDALLVTVWLNPWPEIMADMAASPHVSGPPATDQPFPICINDWVRAQGVPEGAHMDLSPTFNADMPALLRECDAAVFPNRCEGGTNLVAMEALAAGLPCVLSANSGHLDLIGPPGNDAHCYPLTRQTPVTFGPQGADHWRESDVAEIVESLEAIYQDRTEARRRGQAANAFMQDWSWRNQIGRLLTELDRLTP